MRHLLVGLMMVCANVVMIATEVSAAAPPP